MNKLLVSGTVLVCLHFLFVTLYAQEQQKVCADTGYACKSYETCCKFGDGNYGCCPYAYANCCQDQNACCQSGFICTNGTCARADSNDKKN